MIRIQCWSFFCLLALISTPLSTALNLPLQPLYVNVGCYNNPGSLKPQGTYLYESPGYCQQLCWKNGNPIAALTGGNQCYCGTETPDSSYQVDEGSCNLECAGYAMVNCWSPFFLLPWPSFSILQYCVVWDPFICIFIFLRH